MTENLQSEITLRDWEPKCLCISQSPNPRP